MLSKQFGVEINTPKTTAIVIATTQDQGLKIIEETIRQSTEWSMEVAIGLFSSVTFFCVLAYFFRKVD